MSYRSRLIHVLRSLWILFILFNELGVFYVSLSQCRWPDERSTTSTLPTHILLVADPQILDRYSYPGRSRWLMSLTQYIVDFNLRKNWNAVVTKLDPHMVIFLGDMMDNGRSDTNVSEYTRYYERFRSIFRLNAPIPVYYIPGNHDVDLGYSSGSGSQARDRYRTHFGPTNQLVDIGNHTTLVLFDAPDLADEDNRRHGEQVDFEHWQGGKGGAIEFLKSFMQQRPNSSVILFSHIPLFRPQDASCGSLREKGTIRSGAGRGYQNLLSPEASSWILENIHPSIIFSGDDHDYCDYGHRLKDKSTIREVTVKSFSMAMGIRRPGFQLLSVGSPHDSYENTLSAPPRALADVSCLLPDQIRIYTHRYAPLGVLTLLFLLTMSYKQCHHRQSGGTYTTTATADPWQDGLPRHAPRLPRTSSPEKRRLRMTFASDNHFRFGILKPVQVFCNWWTGAGVYQAWYILALKDLCQVAWPPLIVYTIISLWLFRR